eukprot:TRINITY_DN261_c3_g1_i1.p1 TRINITY_DN261_c3_g1~~TRINITY_DN261_c3_g1_i1.p1  ORF type:complete len:386 (+),score=98.95 TRINITY_DN261_c3_g1_i1:65-1159(+)
MTQKRKVPSVTVHAVLPSGTALPLEVEGSESTRTLKTRIAEASCFAVDTITLQFEGEEIGHGDGEQKLTDLPFEDGSEIHVTMSEKHKALQKLHDLRAEGWGIEDVIFSMRNIEETTRNQTEETLEAMCIAGIHADRQTMTHALLLATQCGFTTCIDEILARELADANTEILGTTALHMAAGDNEDLVRVMLKYGADVNTVDVSGDTPLHRAANHGKEGILRVLLEHHADPNAKRTFQGQTALHSTVVGEFRLETMRLLFQHHADPNISDCYGNTALHLAAGRGCVAAVQYLLENKADPDLRDMNITGGTPLHNACKNGHRDVVLLMLRHGADRSIENASGVTPAGVARRRKHFAVATLLEASQ